MPKYAFFDFDGTLISHDSFLCLVKKALLLQPWRILFIILFSPVLLCTAIFKFNKTTAKSCVLWSITVFRGKKETFKFFQETMKEMAPLLWFHQALPQLQALQNEGVEIIIISASGTSWIRALLREQFKNAKLIVGSRCSFCFGGVILSSNNCYGEEKLKRIEQTLGTNFVWHSSWSDHIADLPLLKKAPQRFVITPKNKSIKIFDQELKKDYTLLQWTSNK